MFRNLSLRWVKPKFMLFFRLFIKEMNIILPALPIDGDMSIVEVLEVAIDQPFETKVVLI